MRPAPVIKPGFMVQGRCGDAWSHLFIGRTMEAVTFGTREAAQAFITAKEVEIGYTPDQHRIVEVGR